MADQPLPSVSFQTLTYLEYYAQKDQGSVEVRWEHMKDYEKNPQKAQRIAISQALWNSSRKILSILGDWEETSFLPSRWKVDKYGHSSIHFNSPTWGQTPWKSYMALLHLRGSYVTCRSIDYDFIDFFLMPYSDPYDLTFEYEMRTDPKVTTYLIDKLSVLEEALQDIARIVLEEPEIEVRLIFPPTWEKDCVPVWGGDGYWIKGIIC